MTRKTNRYVVVATRSRPWLIACGRLTAEYEDGSIELADARCCVYYSPPTRSLFGCASHGPQPGSRVSRPVARVVIRGWEAVLDATPEALAAWEAEPWS